MNLFDNWQETKAALMEGLSDKRMSMLNQREYLKENPMKFFLTDYEGNILEEVRVLWRQRAERMWVEMSTAGVDADGTAWVGEVSGYWDGEQHDICRISRYDAISEEWVEETVNAALIVDDRPRITRILPNVIRDAIAETCALDAVGVYHVLS